MDRKQQLSTRIDRKSQLAITDRKLQLSDLITVRRTGNVSLKRTVDDNFWVVSLSNQRVFTYKSSTWAKNKYRRLCVITGIVDDIGSFDEEEDDLCEKQ